MSSDPMEAELLQLKKQLSPYCGFLKNLFLSRSHYNNQSWHSSPEYEVNKDSTNTFVTKVDDYRFHFLQTADTKSQHLGNAEFAETSYCEVSETSLCIIFAINSFPIFSFSRKHFHRVEHSVCSQLRGTRKQQPSLTSWLAVSMYVSGIQSDLLLELI